MLDRGLVFRFAFSYTDTHRQQLSEFEDFNDFNQNFFITPDLFVEFTEYAEEKGIGRDSEGVQASKERIKTLLKAYIARNLFDDDGFYPIYHQIDETFLKAIDYLKEKS